MAFGEKKGNKGDVPKTATLQPRNQDLHIWLIAELLDDSRTLIQRTITSQVEEVPSFILANPANDASESAELNVDDHLGAINISSFWNFLGVAKFRGKVSNSKDFDFPNRVWKRGRSVRNPNSPYQTEPL